jgi:hypothetical protein
MTIDPILSAVGFPLGSIMLFALLESVWDDQGFWQRSLKIGLDMCIVSIGVVGGFAGNDALTIHLQGHTSTYIAAGIFLELFLAALVMKVQKKSKWAPRWKGSACLFFGGIAVAVPSIMLVWLGN